MDLPRHILEETGDELYDHAPCGYLSTLVDGTIVRVNQTFLDWTGHDRRDLLGRRRFQDLLTVPGRIFHDTHFGPLLQMQGFVREVAFDVLRVGRPPLPALVNAVRRSDAGGRPVLVRLTVFDATDRRQYERELLAARDRAERAAETERAAREAAERAGRVKDDFLAMVSHELRTPLNAILGWAQLLRRRAAGDADLLDGLGVIERNARVQAQLVEDLLDMARVVSGKMRLDAQPVDLSAAVGAAVESARPAADARGVRLAAGLDAGAVVTGDAGRLQQVFWNLLSNAIKFTPPGGDVSVTMVRGGGGPDAGHVDVRVADTGQGMTAEFIAHAFERFRQSDSAGTRQTKGLGLGLSIVKQLVDMHGGSVRAESAGEGLGSTFVVRLPLAAAASQAGPAGGGSAVAAGSCGPLGAQAFSLGGVRVLVVDDQEDARDLVRLVLQGCGAEVAVAASVVDAMAALEGFAADVIVSDIGMPDADGYELIRRVRMLGGGVGATKAIALTAFGRVEDRTRALLAGFQTHMVKPVEPQELVVTVASLVGRVTAGRAEQDG